MASFVADILLQSEFLNFAFCLKHIFETWQLFFVIRSSDESVTELRLHRSRVDTWFSMSGTVGAPVITIVL